MIKRIWVKNFTNLQKKCFIAILCYYFTPNNPSKIEWDLTNGPLSKLLELLDTEVLGSVQWVLLEISWKQSFLCSTTPILNLLNLIHTVECAWCNFSLYELLMSEQVQRDQVGSSNDEVYDQRNLNMKIWKEEGAKLQTLTNHQTLSNSILKNPWKNC